MKINIQVRQDVINGVPSEKRYSITIEYPGIVIDRQTFAFGRNQYIGDLTAEQLEQLCTELPIKLREALAIK